jgi:hypothetical protein
MDCPRREDQSIAAAGFALLVATFAQAMTPAPVPQPDGMISQIAANWLV